MTNKLWKIQHIMNYIYCVALAFLELNSVHDLHISIRVVTISDFHYKNVMQEFMIPILSELLK